MLRARQEITVAFGRPWTRIGVFLVAFLAACVPLSILPSPAPLPGGGSMEFGASLSVGLPLAEECRLEKSVEGLWDSVCRASTESGKADVGPATWALFKLSERVDFGAIAGAGFAGGGFGGLFGRGWIYDRESVRVGVHAEGGAIWWGAGVPAAVRLSPAVWLYTQPEVVYFGDPSAMDSGEFELRGPIGASVDAAPNARLTAELMATWLPSSGHERFNHMSLRATIGVAVHPKAGSER